MRNPQEKILNPYTIDIFLNEWKQENKKIVFTNGCFDLIHPGHVDYLYKARLLGDCLFVGLNTDSSVRKLKGNTRPIQDEAARSIIMASFEFVDAVMLFEEDTPYSLIKYIEPHILVKGGDYKPEEIAGYDIVMKSGGKVITLDFLTGYSTSSIENKIRTHHDSSR